MLHACSHAMIHATVVMICIHANVEQAGAIAAMLDEGEAVMIDPAELEARAAEQAANAGDDDTTDTMDKPKFDELTAAEMSVSDQAKWLTYFTLVAACLCCVCVVRACVC
jgi:hypothetical protein